MGDFHGAIVLLSTFCVSYAAGRLNLSDSAAAQLRYSVTAFSAHLGREATVADLTKVQVVSFLRAYSSGRSPASVNSKRGALLCLWRAAAEEGLSPPAPRLERMRLPERVPVVFTLQDVNALLKACDSTPGQWMGVPCALAWRLCVLTLWDTAARIGELLSAKTTDVELHAGVWFVPAAHVKGRRRDRMYRLHADTLEAIRLSLTWPRVPLFPFPWRKRQVWEHFERLLQRAGLPADSRHKFHCLRRTAESYAAAQRGDAWAAEAVGHSLTVARASYINPLIATRPALIDALPRP